MPTEGKILASTGLIFGTFAILLFLAPFFLYAKNQNDIEKEGVLKVMGEIFFFHVIMMIILVIFTSAINAIVLRPEFMPENGIKYFFGAMNSNSESMWSYWLHKSINTSSNIIGPDADIFAAFIAAMSYYALFFYIICIVIPLAVLWQVVGQITKGDSHTFYQEWLEKVQTGFMSFFGITTIVLAHCSISSLYVQLYISDFSFMKLINIAWHGLLF